MFFLAFFLVGNFCPIFCEKSGIIVEGDSTVSDQINSTSLELEESLDCTTSSLSGNFSGCHSDEIKQSKAVFIANAATVISIGAPANLITLLALPYVRLRWAMPTGHSYKKKTICNRRSQIQRTDFYFPNIPVPRYPDEVPDLYTNTAILILHLSFTDFLYCILGLPFILATLYYGYFP